MLSSFHIIAHAPTDNIDLPSSPMRWNSPPRDTLKVNVDAAVMSSKDYFGIGIVGRYSNGIVQFSEGRCLIGSFTPHFAERMALKWGWRKLYHLLGLNGRLKHML